MKIVESLQNRLPETVSVHRATIIDPENDPSPVSVVFVQVPPHHRFPLHIHPRSEDCFFILSGAGEVFDPRQRYPVAEIAGVWIPPGVPHGLTAGPSGVIEIGFQSPPGPTLELTASCAPHDFPSGIDTASLPTELIWNHTTPHWQPVFTGHPGRRELEPHYSRLNASQELYADADGYTLLVVVVQGRVRLRGRTNSLDAVTLIQLEDGEREIFHALEANTLLLTMRSHRLD